jgi:hypothetical protein
MDDQRLEEIAERHAGGYAHKAKIAAAIREALSSQEEELRKVATDRDVFEVEMRRVRPMADAYEAVLRHCGIENDVIGHVRRQEEELRSLREERELAKDAIPAGVTDDYIKRAESAEAELLRLHAKACSCICHEDGVAPILKFYADVNARAEAEMLNGKPVTGAHHRALEAEIIAYRQKVT